MARPAPAWLAPPVDGVAEWTEAQRRVIGLVRGLSAQEAETSVPACPDWTVRDLFSHMVGLGADVVAGDEPDDHNEAWTAKQVAARRDRDVAALVAEWEDVAGPLRAWMRAHGIRALFDVTIHEQDLRGAVGPSDLPGHGRLYVDAAWLGATPDPAYPAHRTEYFHVVDATTPAPVVRRLGPSSSEDLALYHGLPTPSDDLIFTGLRDESHFDVDFAATRVR